MGFIIIIVIAITALICSIITGVAIALTLWLIKDPHVRKRTIRIASIITPLLWLGIYFWPVDYGKPASNYDILMAIWLKKTAATLFSPAAAIIVFAIFFTFLNKVKK